MIIAVFSVMPTIYYKNDNDLGSIEVQDNIARTIVISVAPQINNTVLQVLKNYIIIFEGHELYDLDQSITNTSEDNRIEFINKGLL